MNFVLAIKRWLVWLLVAALFALACVFLSQWQFNRRAEALAKIHLISENFDQTAKPLSDLVSNGKFNPSLEWRPVELEGHFLPDKAVLVRNRPLNGQAGFLQVIPFETADGDVVAVETGWLPTGNEQDSPDMIPLPSANKVSIVARLRSVEPTLGRDAPVGQIATINVESLIEKVQLKKNTFTEFYVRAAESYSSQALPKVLSKPELTEGNHLSYALQWILFAIMAFAALWWAVRQELLAKKIAADPNFVPKNRKKVGDDDKAAEDAAN